MEYIIGFISLTAAILTGAASFIEDKLKDDSGSLEVHNSKNQEIITGRVTSISDGDTLTILTTKKQRVYIRIFGIDAPEKSQPFGARARQALAKLCFKADAVIQPSGKSYDRIVGSVSCNGKDVARFMVGSGFAWVYERYTRDGALLALQAQARKEKLGLWADARPVPPWKYRRQHSGPSRPGERRADMDSAALVYIRTNLVYITHSHFHAWAVRVHAHDGHIDGKSIHDPYTGLAGHLLRSRKGVAGPDRAV